MKALFLLSYKCLDRIPYIGRADYADAFEHLEIAEPLLTEDGDFEAVATAITEATAQYDDGETAICFMGHGTEAESNMVYSKMQTLLESARDVRNQKELDDLFDGAATETDKGKASSYTSPPPPPQPLPPPPPDEFF